MKKNSAPECRRCGESAQEQASLIRGGQTTYVVLSIIKGLIVSPSALFDRNWHSTTYCRECAGLLNVYTVFAYIGIFVVGAILMGIYG